MDARLRRVEEQLTRVRQLCESGELWGSKSPFAQVGSTFALLPAGLTCGVRKVRRTQSKAVERSPLTVGVVPVLSLAVIAATLYSILRILLDERSGRGIRCRDDWMPARG
jgi:hypothetical protein